MVAASQFQYGQLFWWRESPEIHTLITLWGYPLSTIYEAEHFLLDFHLFDVGGKLQTTWQQSLSANECIFIDSAGCPATRELSLAEGVLVLYITIQSEEIIQVSTGTLYSIIDWYSEAGELVSLHNDQIIEQQKKAVEWTEIVVRETIEEQNSLVVLNGPEHQPQNSITLEIKNHLGAVCSAIFTPAIDPFSLVRLQLSSLFPDILSFSQGKSITVSGTFTSFGVFVRPYVVTEGKYLGAYHGGDRQFWENIPATAYKFMGQGEVNPMLALHQEDVTTVVNLLNTHSTLEQDFWVDAKLYDCAGNLVASKQKWQLARRNELCQVSVADLLPDHSKPFVGHIALRFADDDHPEYPKRLQALMEYRTAQSSAKVMAWSDFWNWQERAKFAPVLNYMAYYRVWWQAPFLSYLSLTNCGIDADYDLTATYRLRLENGRGEFLLCEGTIPPQGTLYKAAHELFPSIADFLGEQSVALLVVETTADLASMHLTQHQVSGVYAAEHFLPTYTLHNDEFHSPCGS
jgi:hypothetical protein